jgi:hypothetical protein
LKGDEEGFTRRIRYFGSHNLRKMARIEYTFVHAGHFAVREQGGSCRVADVESSNSRLAAMNVGQKQGRGDDDTQGDCCKNDYGFPSHARTIKAGKKDVNVKF